MDDRPISKAEIAELASKYNVGDKLWVVINATHWQSFDKRTRDYLEENMKQYKAEIIYKNDSYATCSCNGIKFTLPWVDVLTGVVAIKEA